jgi:hypothetical protein
VENAKEGDWLVVVVVGNAGELWTDLDGEELGIGRNGSPVDSDGRIREPRGWSLDCERLSSERGGDESEYAVSGGDGQRNRDNTRRARRTGGVTSCNERGLSSFDYFADFSADFSCGDDG